MKKLVLSIFALTSFITIQAQCSDIFISEYVEGSNNNKALELYNPTPNPIALNNNYRMVRYNNGTSALAGDANPQARISLGTHVMAPYSTWVIVIDRRDTTITSGTDIVVAPGLRALADTFLCSSYLVSYTMNFNGNDAISLQKTTDGGTTWNLVDLFGMMGDAAMVGGASWSDAPPYDGSTGAGAWWTLNHTLIRKASVTSGVTANPSPEFIVTTEYDSLPEDTWTNLHTHNCVCFTGIQETSNSDASLVVYPNPVTGNYFTVSSKQNMESVEVVDLVGRQVIRKQTAHHERHTFIITYQLAKGVYNVKVNYEDGSNKTMKLVVK